MVKKIDGLTERKGGPQKNLRKANEAIAIKPTSGKMTFLSRKIFNSLLYHAQGQGDIPVYKVPLSEFVASLDYESRDTKLLQNHLRRMVETTVEWHDPNKRWGVGSLLGEAEIKFDGRNSTVEWSYTPKVKGFLLDPERYTPISLQYQAILRTHGALALFEICSRYETNPSGLTNRAPPEWWYPVLTGNSESTPGPHFYRYFKRDTLSPSIVEINGMTHLHVELIEHKQGRKVIEIQFAISAKAQATLDLPAPPIIDSALMDRISHFGIAKSEAEEIFASHPEALLRATIGLVEDRIKNSRLPELDSSAAFFKSALRHGYAVKKPAAQKALASAGLDQLPPAEALADTPDPEANSAMARFESLPILDQKRRLEQFAESLKEPLRSTYAKQGLGSAVIRRSLAGWLVKSGNG